MNGNKGSDIKSWLVWILSYKSSSVIPCHSTLHEILYSFLKIMRIFKAEVLMWSPLRVRVATEKGNQSTLSERLYSES